MLLPFILAVLVGLFLSMVVLPTMLPSLINSMTGSNPKVYWYLSRGTAVVGYLLLCLSMAMGLLMTGKLATPGRRCPEF